ncbi:MAG: phage virion morphogenesis protein [Candidatus Pacearchaeota archaeon]
MSNQPFIVKVEWLTKLSEWIQKADNNFKSIPKLLKIIGRRVVDEAVMDYFLKKESPKGEKWKDLSPNYAKKKLSKKGVLDILIGEGTLRKSIKYWVIGERAVAVGVNSPDVPYARAHQKGYKDKNIPARPYLGIGKKEEEIIDRTVLDWIGGILNK